MKLMSFAVSGRNSYGAVVGDGVVDLGRRLGDRYPTLRAAIAGGVLDRAAAEVSGAAPDMALAQVTLLPPITDPDGVPKNFGRIRLRRRAGRHHRQARPPHRQISCPEPY